MPCICAYHQFAVHFSFSKIVYCSGRGRTPTEEPLTVINATSLTEQDDAYFLRDVNNNGLDANAFHYSIYRSLTRMMGMDGNLAVANDIVTNLVDGWNQMLITNDFLDPFNGEFDPKHLLGTSNFDVFRWNGLEYGEDRNNFAIFVSLVLVPGIPMVSLYAFTR